jgi:O-acetyl-ADP-ribose deacetylase (regulator of RNase III)
LILGRNGTYDGSEAIHGPTHSDTEEITMEWTIKGKKLVILQGDITEMETDAIVNAANQDLILGAGVAGAIRTKGGPTIQEECNRIGGTTVGGAVITTGGKLKARYVIHAVGPRMGEGDEDQKLTDATRSSLAVAHGKALKSIAFPAVSTGIFGFPKDRCARIMLRTALETLRQRETSLEKVVFCLWDKETLEIFQETAKGLLSPK